MASLMITKLIATNSPTNISPAAETSLPQVISVGPPTAVSRAPKVSFAIERYLNEPPKGGGPTYGLTHVGPDRDIVNTLISLMPTLGEPKGNDI